MFYPGLYTAAAAAMHGRASEPSAFMVPTPQPPPPHVAALASCLPGALPVTAPGILPGGLPDVTRSQLQGATATATASSSSSTTGK